MRTTVDESSCSALGLCECGSRFLAVTYTQARRRLAQHEETAHPSDKHARDALRKHLEHLEKFTAAQARSAVGATI